MTTTFTTVSNSGGVAPAAVGGIVAGIVGGFLILGAIMFFILFRKANTTSAAPGGYSPRQLPQEPKWEEENRASANINDGGRLDARSY